MGAVGVTDRAGAGRPLGPRLDSRSALGGAHSPQALGFPKQGQLVGGDVGVEEGEALQDALHQALGRCMLPESSAGLRATDGPTARLQERPGQGSCPQGPPQGALPPGVWGLKRTVQVSKKNQKPQRCGELPSF